MVERKARVAIVLVLGGVFACTSLEGLSGAPSDAGVDATPDAPTSEATPPPPPNGDAASDARLPYATVVLADSPIVYYRLGEKTGTAIDLGSAGASGTYGINVLRATTSLLGSDADPAATFTGSGGTDAIVRVAPNPKLQPATGLSVECWIRTTGSTDARLVSYGEDKVAPYEAYVLQFQGNRPELYLGSTQTLLNGVTTLVHGQTYHLVGTWDGGSARLFVNGQTDALVPASGMLGPYDANPGLGIGGGYSGTGSLLVGSLDEVAIYDHALSAERIAAHYEAGR